MDIFVAIMLVMAGIAIGAMVAVLYLGTRMEQYIYTTNAMEDYICGLHDRLDGIEFRVHKLEPEEVTKTDD